MTTIPPHAQKSNLQKPRTIYALIEPVDHPVWTDVRYIGVSVNVQSRYAQHLACRSDESNEDKNEWVSGLLAQGKLPLLYELETVDTAKQGIEREQYWIRYAMSQGAKILNRAITYTEQERTEIHAQRAMVYARIAEILAQGTYVKRWDGSHWYPPRMLDRYSVPNDCDISLVNTFTVGFKRQDDSIVSVHDATDEEFDGFIRSHIPIYTQGSSEWTLGERCDAIGYAMAWGKQLVLYEVPRPEKKSRRKQRK